MDSPALEGAPRPVFQGDWGKADGKARQAHMTLIAAWKAANGEPTRSPSSATVEPNERHAGNTPSLEGSELAASTRVLEAIRDDPKALRSDRIRAAEALMRSATAKASSGDDHVALWVAQRMTLEALPPADRMSALLGALEEVGEEMPAAVA